MQLCVRMFEVTRSPHFHRMYCLREIDYQVKMRAEYILSLVFQPILFSIETTLCHKYVCHLDLSWPVIYYQKDTCPSNLEQTESQCISILWFISS